MRRWDSPWTAALAIVLATSLARAEDPKQVARDLAQQGFDLFEAGKYQEALDRFRKAEEKFHAPPHLSFSALALDKLGKLREARDLCKRVADEKLPKYAPKPYRTAIDDAKTELESLQKRIPTLSIRVTGAPLSSVHAWLDDRVLGPPELAQPMDLDPGEYTVRIEAPGMASQSRRVKLGEGVHENLELILQPAPPPEPPRGSIVPGAVTLAAGGAGLAIGAITGVLSLSKVSQLHDACPGMRCPAREASTIDSARTLGTVSTVGFVAGGALAAAGVVLVIVRPGGAQAPSVTVGPGSLSLHGSF